MIASPVYEEIIDFLAAGTTPDAIISFRPSQDAKERVEDLIRREKTSSLSVEDADELNHYMQLEHIMRLAKIRARQYLQVFSR